VTVSRTADDVIERHQRTEWVLDACVVEEVRTVNAGEPLPSDVRPMGLEEGWARRGEAQARAFVLEGERSAGRTLRLDAWRMGGARASQRAMAVAQAEFYSPSEDPLWSMDWKARLRRFRLPRVLPPGVALPGRELIDRVLVH